MSFSIKWASVGGAYAGVIFGFLTAASHEGLGLFALILGPLMGGLAGLPLTAAQFGSALFVRSMMTETRGAARAIGFVVVSAVFYWFVISMLDSGLRSIGGLLTGDDAILRQILFFVGGTAISLACMALWGDPARKLYLD